MSNEHDFQQKYFDEKFNNINVQLLDLKTDIKDMKRDSRSIEDRLNEVEKAQYNCPVKHIQEKQEKYDEQQTLLSFLFRNPKGFIITLLGYAAGIIFLLLKTYGII